MELATPAAAGWLLYFFCSPLFQPREDLPSYPAPFVSWNFAGHRLRLFVFDFRRRLSFKSLYPWFVLSNVFSSLICRFPHIVPSFTAVDIMPLRAQQLIATCFCHLTWLQLPCLQCSKTNYLSIGVSKGSSQGILDVLFTSDGHVVLSSPANHSIKGKFTLTRLGSRLVWKTLLKDP